MKTFNIFERQSASLLRGKKNPQKYINYHTEVLSDLSSAMPYQYHYVIVGLTCETSATYTEWSGINFLIQHFILYARKFEKYKFSKRTHKAKYIKIIHPQKLLVVEFYQKVLV